MNRLEMEVMYGETAPITEKTIDNMFLANGIPLTHIARGNAKTTSTGRLYWTFYFEIGNNLPEPEEKCLAVYGHCRYCGSRTFVEVPRVPATIFEYGDPDLMCKTCGRIIVESELIYERDDK